MATIKQIDDRTVHRIQSGQVIVDLCSVVKELVENSIDAGATSVDVRFKNQGLDLIEVQDNGSGIAPSNYASVALKHHTSKLASYADIAALQTFGFRGEALASLCALSNFTITTCLASDAPKGSKLTFEPSGKLKATSMVAAQRGTTVTVEKLFHNLPVRRRELERNIKREWHKVISLLNQYACIQTRLKFSVSQQPTKGKRIVLFSTKGNDTTRDNIINIFGAKTMTTLVPLDLKLEMQPSAVEPGMQAILESRLGRSSDVRVVGHVSRPVSGEGRQTPDRQMFFVNGRPCGLPQFAKVFNEVYRSFNSNQSPFIFADIRLDTDMYDVNVSPDKRTILLHDQTRLLDTLRKSLISLFDSHDYSVPMSRPLDRQASVLSAPGRQNQPSQASTSNRNPRSEQKVKGAAQSIDSGGDSAEEEEEDDDVEDNDNSREQDDDDNPDSTSSDEEESVPKRGSLRMFTSRSLRENGPNQRLITPWMNRKPSSTSGAKEKVSSESPKSTLAVRATRSAADDEVESAKPLPVQDFNKRIAEFTAGKGFEQESPPDSPILSTEAQRAEEPPIPASRFTSLRSTQRQMKSPIGRSSRSALPGSTTITIGDVSSACSSRSAGTRRGQKMDELSDSGQSELSARHAAEASSDSDEELVDPEPSLFVAERDSSSEVNAPSDEDVAAEPKRIIRESTRPEVEEPMEETSHLAELETHTPVAEPRAQSFQSGSRRRDGTLQLAQKLAIDMDLVVAQMRSWATFALDATSTQSAMDQVEDIDAKDAEAKLSLIISRDDFARMRIAGQFNLGFIIATRPARAEEGGGESKGGDELFIIDQHASDEKYNFERLQKTTTVQSQPLVHRKRLELTALEEEIIMQNQEAIEANGFKLDMDLSGEAPVGSRCHLTALPLSRETTFDVSDFEELVALLGEESSESSRVPRPSKVRKMFAMRACRSSIMIGRPLTKSQMYGLVKHMGEMDKPWNCPHGRPTMRHLCQLQAWDSKGWNGDTQTKTASAWQMYGAGN